MRKFWIYKAYKTKSKNDEEAKPCDLSDLTEKFGKYQYIQYIMICLPAIWVTMVNINYVFVVGDPDYRCRIDECEDSNSTSQFPSWWPDTSIDRCFKPVIKSGETVCTNNSFTGELATCNNWIYENNNTVVAELDLACQPWSSNLVGTIHSMGMLISMLLFGWISDIIGRKPTFLLCVMGGCIGNIKTFANSYYMYVAIEFLEATITGGSYPAAMVLMMEIVGKKYRLASGVVFAYAIYLGESLFAIFAMYLQHWKNLVRVINGPLIFFIVYIFFINESPRWQIVTGRVEKAKQLMKKIADTNKIHINEEELVNIDKDTLKEKFNIKKNEIKESYLSAFKSKEMLKRILVAGVCRFTSTFVTYGLMINSALLPGDKYMNFLLSTVMSFPGELISLYFMNKIGRKMPLMIGYCICGVLCVLSALIPAGYLWAKLTLFMLGKMIISACFTGALTYAMELFPTSVRGSLLGLGACASRLGGMLAPLTPIMNSVSEVLPYVFFCFFAVLSGILLVLTPETKDLPLFDTIKQVEDYRKNTAQTNESNTTSSVERATDNT